MEESPLTSETEEFLISRGRILTQSRLDEMSSRIMAYDTRLPIIDRLRDYFIRLLNY